MQYNFYNIEILGEEKLKGVAIPVVVDNQKKLTKDQMFSIAKLFNSYRTVFVRNYVSDILEIHVYSINGEMHDCFYGEVAAVFSLTESCYIREIESGEKHVTIREDTHNSRVSISYEDMIPIGVTHKIDFSKVKIEKIEDSHKLNKYQIESLDEKMSTRIIYTEDAVEFSKLRKKIGVELKIQEDKLVVFYDKDFKMVYFHVERANNHKKKLDSRNQLGFIVEFLLSKGIEKQDIQKICHVLKTGQFAVMDANIESDKFYVRMNARTFAEGILNI